MMRVPATAWVFALLVLVLLFAARVGGAWSTIEQTLAARAVLEDSAAGSGTAAVDAAPQPRTSAQEEIVAQAPPPNYLFDAAYLQGARESLLSLPQFEGRPLMLFDDIHFYDDGRVNLLVVDPLQPGNVDEYGFRDGQWQRGKPVNPTRMAPLITLERNSAPLAEIDFAVVARIADALREQRQVLQAEPEEVGHVYVVFRRGKLRWLPEDVHGDRRSVELKYDAAGHVSAVRER